MAIETFNRKILINVINKFKKFKLFFNGAYFFVFNESDINQDKVICYDINGESSEVDINLIEKIKIGSVTLTPSDIQTAIDNIKNPEKEDDKKEKSSKDDEVNVDTGDEEEIESPLDNTKEPKDSSTKKPDNKKTPKESIEVGDFVKYINERSIHNGIKSTVESISSDGYILIKAYSKHEKRMIRLIDKMPKFLKLNNE